VHFSWDFIAYQNSHTAMLKLLPMLLMLALMLVWGGLVAYASEQARGKSPRGSGAPRATSTVVNEDESPAADLPF
jgi:hypothetical protein